MPYQPFLIGDGKYTTGLFDYLKPWVSPGDSFTELNNAYIYRGVLQKRQGLLKVGQMPYEDLLVQGSNTASYSGTLPAFPVVAGSVSFNAGVQTLTDNGDGTLGGDGSGTIDYTSGAYSLTFNASVTTGTPIFVIYTLVTGNPIMGMFQWTDEDTGAGTLVIYDTKRAAYYDTSTNVFVPINSVSQTLWIDDGSTNSISLTSNFVNLTPYTVTISYPSHTTTDNGSGGFAGSGAIQNTTTVNYTTGIITLNLSANSAGRVFTLTTTLSGDYFTGNSSQFFNFVNWLGELYATNNKDPITLYDGTNLSRPPFAITAANNVAFINNIQTSLDIDVYKNRLLIERPTLVNNPGNNGVQGQSIYWSAINNPSNFITDVTGNGGFSQATTDDFIQSCKLLRDQLIVFFQQSTWVFKWTQNQFNPFIWQKISSTKATTAPYACIEYDERITSMGQKGLIACDGVNVQRYDTGIIDVFLKEIDQKHFAQCFGIRFDSTNQSFMLFPSSGTTNTLSDAALVYNFAENTWSIFDYDSSDASRLPSVLGIYEIVNDVTWADFGVDPLLTEYPDWASCDFAWNSFSDADGAPDLLMGAQTGIVYQITQGDTDYGTSINSYIQSIRFNPFANLGQKTSFGFIDIYYSVESIIGLLPSSVLTIDFSVDNSQNSQSTKILTLDGKIGQDTAFKRIYINMVGEFLQMEIQSIQTTIIFNGVETVIPPGNFEILGMILWASPAGRITP